MYVFGYGHNLLRLRSPYATGVLVGHCFENVVYDTQFVGLFDLSSCLS